MIPGVSLAGVAQAGVEMVIVQGGHGTALGVTAMLMTQTRDGNTPGATPEPTLGQTALAILIMLLMGQGQGRAQVQMVKRKMQQLRNALVLWVRQRVRDLPKPSKTILAIQKNSQKQAKFVPDRFFQGL